MRVRLLLLACAALPLMGCGGSRAVPVSGRVTLNGKPLPNATVTFQPVPKGGINIEPTSVGETNAQGEFTLKILGKDQPGAVVGEHLVSISALQGPPPESKDDNPKPRKDLVPPAYNSNTTLKFTVPAEGSTTANFDLQPGKAGPAVRKDSGS